MKKVPLLGVGPLSSKLRKLKGLAKKGKMETSSMSLLTCLQEVSDFRRPQGRCYSLAETLCMVVMSLMSGYCAYREMGRFVRHNQPELVACLGLSREQVPSHVTIRQILMGADFKELAQAFRRWGQRSRPSGTVVERGWQES